MPDKNYQQIQSLRGIAAILVLLYHFSPQLERYNLSFLLPQIDKWGFWGVDIFFVLSGFVIALSSENLLGVKQGSRFIGKRALRIFLGYWPALILWMAIMAEPINQIDSTRIFISFFLTSGYIWTHIFPVAWTLYYELTFYILFSLLIIYVPLNRRSLMIQISALLIFTWCVTWLIARPEDVKNEMEPLKGLVSAYALDFFMGLLIYRARVVLSRNTELIAPLLITALTLLILGAQSPLFNKIELLRVGTYGLAAAAVVAMAVSLEGARHSRILGKIGDASYSLYLTHIIVINLIAQYVNDHIGLTTQTGRVIVLSTPLLAIIFALIWYRALEKPLYEKAVSVFKLNSSRSVR